MGMFDEIICDYPLPGTPPTFIDLHPFQTKDTDCTLDVYHIRADGTTDIAPDLTDTIHFGTSNIVAGSPSDDGYVQFTENGEDGVSVSYSATFVDGKLVDIRETDRSSVPALPRSQLGAGMERLADLMRERLARV